AWAALFERPDASAPPHIVHAFGGDEGRDVTAGLAKVYEVVRANGLVDAAFDAGAPVIRHNVTERRQILGLYVPQMADRYASVATLPLYLDGAPAGVFFLYASRRDAFDHEKEMALLKEMAGDISFALMH